MGAKPKGTHGWFEHEVVHELVPRFEAIGLLGGLESTFTGIAAASFRGDGIEYRMYFDAGEGLIDTIVSFRDSGARTTLQELVRAHGPSGSAVGDNGRTPRVLRASLRSQREWIEKLHGSLAAGWRPA